LVTLLLLPPELWCSFALWYCTKQRVGGSDELDDTTGTNIAALLAALRGVYTNDPDADWTGIVWPVVPFVEDMPLA